MYCAASKEDKLQNKLFYEENSINSTDSSSVIRETTEMLCCAQTPHGQDISGDDLQQKRSEKQCTDLFHVNLSSDSLNCSESESLGIDTSYTTCTSSWPYELHDQMFSDIETIGDQYSQNDVEMLKRNLTKRIEVLLVECEETEMKLLGEDGQDETNQLQYNIIQSAKESALIQLQLIPSANDDKLAIESLQKQIYLLERALCHSNLRINKDLNLKKILKTASKGLLILFNCGSKSERTSDVSAEILAQHILNGLLFVAAIAILIYVYQF